METLEFKKYVREENNLNSHGTVKALAGKGGSIGLIPKNMADGSKRVVVIVGKKDGTSLPISCSAAVSKALRAKTLTVSQLAGLEVLEGDNKIPFISMPAGTGAAVKTVAIDNIKVEAVVAVNTEIDIDELVSF